MDFRVFGIWKDLEVVQPSMIAKGESLLSACSAPAALKQAAILGDIFLVDSSAVYIIWFMAYPQLSILIAGSLSQSKDLA